jgi:hypothetical protein
MGWGTKSMNDNAKELVSQHDLLTIIEDYVSKSQGLKYDKENDGNLSILQKGDEKGIVLKTADLVEVLSRKDAEGKEFVQINFTSGKKILLTDQLIGFKPFPVPDLDISKLPKVVTTVDLLSVFEAIEDAVSQTAARPEEADTLKKVFQSILLGGEDVGFDLSTERSWLRRLPTVISKTSA